MLTQQFVALAMVFNGLADAPPPCNLRNVLQSEVVELVTQLDRDWPIPADSQYIALSRAARERMKQAKESDSTPSLLQRAVMISYTLHNAPDRVQALGDNPFEAGSLPFNELALRLVDPGVKNANPPALSTSDEQKLCVLIKSGGLRGPTAR